MLSRVSVAVVLLLLACMFRPAPAEILWIEGEKPAAQTMTRHPWWYDQVKRDQLSGGDFISNFDKDKRAEAEYAVAAEQAGRYQFWVRANPVQARTLKWRS